MKRYLAFLFVLIIMAVSFTGCGEKESEEPAPVPTADPTESIIGNIPDGSILTYLPDDEGCLKLITDMEAGNIPVQFDAMYDEMGARPLITLTDPEAITEMYNRFGKMTVGEATEETMTDRYHFIEFTLQDGTHVSFSFEGPIWHYGNTVRNKVSDNGGLWQTVKELQDQLIEGQN